MADDSITIWLEQLKVGDSGAANRLWSRYVERLVRVADNRLRGAAKRAADEEDVVLSAFHAFLQGVDDGRFAQLDDRDDLWQLLVMLTERRAIALRRRENAEKRGGGAVRGQSAFMHADEDASERCIEPPAPDVSPDFAVEASERLRVLLGKLTEVERRVAMAKLEGLTNQEIGDRMGISLRSVERKLSMIRDQWSAAEGDE